MLFGVLLGFLAIAGIIRIGRPHAYDFVMAFHLERYDGDDAGFSQQ